MCHFFPFLCWRERERERKNKPEHNKVKKSHKLEIFFVAFLMLKLQKCLLLFRDNISIFLFPSIYFYVARIKPNIGRELLKIYLNFLSICFFFFIILIPFHFYKIYINFFEHATYYKCKEIY